MVTSLNSAKMQMRSLTAYHLCIRVTIKDAYSSPTHLTIPKASSPPTLLRKIWSTTLPTGTPETELTRARNSLSSPTYPSLLRIGRCNARPQIEMRTPEFTTRGRTCYDFDDLPDSRTWAYMTLMSHPPRSLHLKCPSGTISHWKKRDFPPGPWKFMQEWSLGESTSNGV